VSVSVLQEVLKLLLYGSFSCRNKIISFTEWLKKLVSKIMCVILCTKVK